MYPLNYFALFPPFPREDKVFVAMDFDSQFQDRWDRVIAPGIRHIKINDVPLEPHRVDARQISDSILTEILGGITNDLVIFADVTSIGRFRPIRNILWRPGGLLRFWKAFNKKPIRNGNVMYEVGLAQAVRLPEEVLLFRSDSDDLLFDVRNVRVNSYNPDQDPDGSRKQVADAIEEALREVDLKRHLAVKRAAESLDFKSWIILAQAHGESGVQHFSPKTLGQAPATSENNTAIRRLLEIGALSTDYLTITPDLVKSEVQSPSAEMLKHKPTAFGRAISRYIGKEMGMTNPDVVAAFEELIRKGAEGTRKEPTEEQDKDTG